MTTTAATPLRALAMAVAAVTLAIGLPASALADEPTRIFVAIGQNVGAPDDDRLLYAERDAERMASVLTTLGDVSKDRSYVVTDASADRVRQVLSEVRGRAMELSDVVLIAYVSGHADEHGLRLGPSRLPHTELRALLASIPARLRLLIVDTCESGALIRQKGGKPAKPFAIDLESSMAIQGQVVIASTGPSEPAQEWESLGGALFTHHFLAALRGAADLDGDGRVTLFEAYAYTYDRTLTASSGAWAGSQHPSHEIELRGAGDLVLTRPGGRSSGLMLGSPLAGRYIISQRFSGELTAEIDKRAGRAMRLALDPGRYLVRKPEGAFVRVGELEVPPGGLARLDDSELEQVPYAEVARRGASPLRLWWLELGAGFGTGVVNGSGGTPRLGVALGREYGPWALSGGVDFGVDSFRGERMEIDQRELWASFDARLRFPVTWLLPYVSAHGAVGWVHQSITRDQEQMIRAVFDTGAVPSRDGPAGQLRAALGLELPWQRWLVRVEVAGGVMLSPVDEGLLARPLVLGRVISGLRF